MKAVLSEQGYLLDTVQNIYCRPGYREIDYNDGDAVEEKIAAIVSAASDVSLFSEELRVACTDWVTNCHLHVTRANLLRPFRSLLTGKVLEIGAGCGALTRYLGECGAEVIALE